MCSKNSISSFLHQYSKYFQKAIQSFAKPDCVYIPHPCDRFGLKAWLLTHHTHQYVSWKKQWAALCTVWTTHSVLVRLWFSKFPFQPWQVLICAASLKLSSSSLVEIKNVSRYNQLQAEQPVPFLLWFFGGNLFQMGVSDVAVTQ